ncbi:hypothetical protein RB601_003619 [Gaeumannomyces tritici]
MQGETPLSEHNVGPCGDRLRGRCEVGHFLPLSIIRLRPPPATSLLSLKSTDKMAEQGQTLLRNLKQSEARDTATCNEWLGQLHALTKSTVGRELAASLTSADLAVIAHFGFRRGGDPTDGQISALRCLNNVLVLHAPMGQMFVDARLPEGAIELLNKSVARCVEAAAKQQLDTSYVAHLSLLSVLAARYDAHACRFLGSLDGLFQMLSWSTVRPNSPLDQPIVQLIDCLAALLPSLSETAGVPPQTSLYADKLVDILDCAIRAYRKQADFETRLTPLVSLMYHVSKLAPTSAKKQMQSRLLATNRDRQQPLGRGDSLPHLVVTTATEAATALKPVLANLLLELSDGIQDQLVHNVGFGCAAGLLQCLGLPLTAPMPNVEKETVATNPITGQLQSMDLGTQERLPEMTAEEKLQEAERLFIAFERLRETGVISVENPVVEAARAGRIQELSDSDCDGPGQFTAQRRDPREHAPRNSPCDKTPHHLFFCIACSALRASFPFPSP